MKSKGRQKKNEGYRCAVSKVQVEWLAMMAFQRVLGKRQSKYSRVLEWLAERIAKVEGKEKGLSGRMRGVVVAACQMPE
jgi:hypothetical protein